MTQSSTSSKEPAFARAEMYNQIHTNEYEILSFRVKYNFHLVCEGNFYKRRVTSKICGKVFLFSLLCFFGNTLRR